MTTTTVDTTKHDTIAGLLMFALIVAIHAAVFLGIAQLVYLVGNQIYTSIQQNQSTEELVLKA